MADETTDEVDETDEPIEISEDEDPVERILIDDLDGPDGNLQ